MVWQYTGYGVVSMAAAVISAVLAVVFWRKRPTPGAMSIALAMFMVALWSATYAFELWSADLQSKLFWTATEYPTIVSIPWLWLAFTLEYTGKTRWITLRNVLLAAIVPVVTVLLVWTGSTLMYPTVGVETVNGVAIWAGSRGPWWWTNILYAYIPLMAATFLMWQAFIQSPRLFRGQVTAVLVGGLVPWLSNVLYVSGLSPARGVDFTPLAFTLTGMAVFLGYSRFHLLDIAPVPRDAILDATSDGMIVLDAQNRVVYVNEPAQKIVGRPDSQTMGMPAAQGLADRLGLMSSLQSEGETGAELVLDEAVGPRYYDLRVSPLRSNRGRLNGRLATLRDITDHKLMERALRESEGRYRGLVESQSELIVRVDPEGRFTFVNDAYCSAFGKSREELLGQTFMPLVHEDDLPHTLAAMEKLTQPPYRASMEQRALTASGWRWLAWEDYALRDERGSIVEIQGVARDITESRRAEEERQRLEAQILHTQKLESLGVLAGGIAHDFNNLLVGILGHADLMMTSLAPGSPAHEDVKQIELAARRAADLTRQMLAYSGKGRFVVEPVDLSALVEEIAQLLSISVSKNTLLEYHLDRKSVV
jgi:two-component system, cell cycle sensor histidine kinase and response regulator CckA